MIRVEVSITADPDGRPALLLQLPYGYILLRRPDDVRALISTLGEAVTELEDADQ